MHHHFVPTQFYRTIGTHPVALEIDILDSVTIECVDAHGIDRHNNQITPAGNPMSGPIAVRGMTHGDVLAITFMSIEPIRSHGWSYPTLAGNVLDPEYITAMPYTPGVSLPKEYWDVDVTAQQVVSRGTHGRSVTVPYAPMVGCFGVAPARGEAISTATSGRYGGNMDYKHFTTGCTIYLPVAVDGALFHVGDGHLVQGCGEIGGTGVESAIAVTCAFAKAPMNSIVWPRAEDATHIYTIGNARPLDQALQHATSEMHRWLVECGADATTAAVLMSQAVEYDIGNVFDPAYTIACKMKKSLLDAHQLRSTFRS